MALKLDRLPYHGLRRKLVLAFDVGTTFSGVSYSILDPGEVPKIFTVTMYPGQTSCGGDSKVPSIVEYDAIGAVRAVGAEASYASDIGEAEEKGWTRVEWFKLHLSPQTLRLSLADSERIQPLPQNKTVVDVLADFVSYLYRCARDHIQRTHAAGDQLFSSLQNQVEFVFGHPNGWGGMQQAQMRRAVVVAGLVPDMETGHSRVQFVTEGEASLHYCVHHGLSEMLTVGSNVMILDAGGGTIDISSFSLSSTSPTVIKEVAPAECRLQGSVFVNRRAYVYLLEEKLKDSAFDDPQDVEGIVQHFELIKRRFKSQNGPVFIRFGTSRDHDPEVGITRGVLKLAEDEVARLFVPSLEAILDAVYEQKRLIGGNLPVFMVGGFASSDWLFTSLQQRLRTSGMKLLRPDGYTNKAVADGALSFYLDHFVSTRVAKTAYGTSCNRIYRPDDPTHLARYPQSFVDAEGWLLLPNGFTAILSKGTSVSEDREYRCSLVFDVAHAQELNSAIADITVYRGADPVPQWTDINPGMFETLCTVVGDTSGAAASALPRRGRHGKLYYRLKFQVVLLFGLAELKAQIAWREKGKELRSPAKIVYG
ncbi:hypothetical protein JAAARDRAFT_483334 [Jaapia argillacea MUCL 33604]|uniref:Uncharacterized protein n=1 Tax=Jaapia argillacea MUCL 33604 TaxID=933084 RepID=A0A067PC11_9AGAM|nr:hypothetical protein JAAARDRAFT_483334 [Jaapia argillacea MUCL 33604]